MAIRMTRTFIAQVPYYQPLMDSGAMLFLLRGPRALGNTKTDLTLAVGRLH